MVFSPMTRPRASASGPPEFPGASRTAACTHILWPNPRNGPSACTTPVVSAPTKPKGFPTARTSSPGRKALESPSVASGNPLAAILAVARSRRVSRLVTSASNNLPSQSSIRARFSRATCALVTISPLESQITPDPAPELPRPAVITCTVERLSRSATSPNPSGGIMTSGGAFPRRRLTSHEARRRGRSRRGHSCRGIPAPAPPGHHQCRWPVPH